MWIDHVDQLLSKTLKIIGLCTKYKSVYPTKKQLLYNILIHFQIKYSNYNKLTKSLQAPFRDLLHIVAITM